jgi:hypothetical protein
VSLANWYGARLQRNVTLLHRGKQQFATHRVHEPILDLRPAVIIDGHGATEIVIIQSAQIGNLVPDLRDRIAEATQNNRRNAWYPEIPQPS